MITREEVIEIVKECGPYVDSTFEGDCRFAIAFAQACYRRGVEDAAKVCESSRNVLYLTSDRKVVTLDDANAMANKCAAGIRKLMEE